MSAKWFFCGVSALVLSVLISCSKDDKDKDWTLSASGTYTGKMVLDISTDDAVISDNLKRITREDGSATALVVKNSLLKSKTMKVTAGSLTIPMAFVLEFEQTSSTKTGATFTVQPTDVIKSETGFVRSLKVTGCKSAQYEHGGKGGKDKFSYELTIEGQFVATSTVSANYKGTIRFETTN